MPKAECKVAAVVSWTLGSQGQWGSYTSSCSYVSGRNFQRFERKVLPENLL